MDPNNNTFNLRKKVFLKFILLMDKKIDIAQQNNDKAEVIRIISKKNSFIHKYLI